MWIFRSKVARRVSLCESVCDGGPGESCHSAILCSDRPLALEQREDDIQ